MKIIRYHKCYFLYVLFKSYSFRYTFVVEFRLTFSQVQIHLITHSMSVLSISWTVVTENPPTWGFAKEWPQPQNYVNQRSRTFINEHARVVQEGKDQWPINDHARVVQGAPSSSIYEYVHRPLFLGITVRTESFPCSSTCFPLANLCLFLPSCFKLIRCSTVIYNLSILCFKPIYWTIN